jgi:hypothetical protein
MTQWVEDLFSNLRNTTWSVESPHSPYYNCIAYAAGETYRWWEPTPNYYWPPHLPRVVTLENFIGAFQSLGYEHSDNAVLEPGYEKVALYVNEHGKPTHAARQQESGKWIRKLGRNVDIEHETPQGLAGDQYGRVAQILKRSLTSRDN